jgi:multimeric flavodoxin WrbA
VVDYRVPFGVSSYEGEGDEWPLILDKIKAADIVVMGMPIWFGLRSSVAQMVIERLDGTYNERNAVGQYPMYGKVGGVVVTGNEDGAHSCAESTLFNMSHLGFTIPPKGTRSRAKPSTATTAERSAAPTDAPSATGGRSECRVPRAEANFAIDKNLVRDPQHLPPSVDGSAHPGPEEVFHAKGPGGRSGGGSRPAHALGASRRHPGQVAAVP